VVENIYEETQKGIVELMLKVLVLQMSIAVEDTIET
jgi:hypothetical protein